MLPLLLLGPLDELLELLDELDELELLLDELDELELDELEEPLDELELLLDELDELEELLLVPVPSETIASALVALPPVLVTNTL